MFLHNPLPRVEGIERNDSGPFRVYHTPGGTFPSITTVLSCMPKSGLDEWKAAVGEEEAKNQAERAARRGTFVHNVIERYLDNEDITEDLAMPYQRALFRNIAPVLDRISNIRLQEAFLYSRFLRIAGAVDCIADFDGELSTIDFKTSNKKKEVEHILGYFLQEAAYSVMFDELYGLSIDKLVTIIVTDEEEVQVFTRSRGDCLKYLLKYRDKFERLHNGSNRHLHNNEEISYS